MTSTTIKDPELEDGSAKAEALLDQVVALFCVLIRIICPLKDPFSEALPI